MKSLNNVNIKTEHGLQAFCDYWKDVLNLKHWDIKAEYAPSYEMGRYVGEVNHHEKIYTARIKIKYEKDYNPTNFEPYDAELVLVHELIHVLFCMFSDYAQENEERGIEYERAVEMTARALVNLRRNKAVEP